jgi:DNA helicase IV
MAIKSESVHDLELAAEQAYFDHALDRRELQRSKLAHVPEGAANPKAAVHLREAATSYMSKMRPPEDAVAFGRIDHDDAETWYIGYNAIKDADGARLVVNWQAQVAAPWYEATHDDPKGLRSRRRYETSGNTILDFDDVVFADLTERVARLVPEPEFKDALLSELSRSRTGSMGEIVQTIQAAQYEVIRSPLDQLLVLQGGPGTGKTVVGLHRVSWLLFNYREQLKASDVLVVGPNRTFVRYIRDVLPSIGDEDVRHADLRSLLTTQVLVGREEDDPVAKLKGDVRMCRLLERGLRDRVGIPERQALEIKFSGRTLAFPPNDIQKQVDRFARLTYAEGRRQLRQYVRDQLVRRLGDAAIPADVVDNFVDRIWPQLTPASFVQDLLGSEARLLRAGGDDFTAAEIRVLYRRASDRLAEEMWTDADVALLDEAEHLIHGSALQTYGHVVVDEAQDLSPMQLRMIARRAKTGSMTVLGDLAQSTGPWARDSWDDVVEHLRKEVPVRVDHLLFGYRVPRQIFQIAARVLTAAAPSVEAPEPVRDGPTEPQFLRASSDELVAKVVDAARSYAADGNMVGIICPTAIRVELERELVDRNVQWGGAADGSLDRAITVLAPAESKGLEFDAVVVAEPERIVSDDEKGYRLLYVSLTRTTRHLTVAHSGQSLIELVGSGRVGEVIDLTEGPSRHSESSKEPGTRLLESLAVPIVQQIRDVVRPELWHELLTIIEKELDDTGE